jgi:hypothetical protein
MTREIFFEKHKASSYGIFDVFRQRMNLTDSLNYHRKVKIRGIYIQKSPKE